MEGGLHAQLGGGFLAFLSFSLAAEPTKRLNHQRIEEGGREGGRLDAERCLPRSETRPTNMF